MTTRELVVRMAAFFGGYPHEIWQWPFHYFVNVRREYLKILGLSSQDVKLDTYAPGVTVETFDF